MWSLTFWALVLCLRDLFFLLSSNTVPLFRLKLRGGTLNCPSQHHRLSYQSHFTTREHQWYDFDIFENFILIFLIIYIVWSFNIQYFFLPWLSIFNFVFFIDTYRPWKFIIFNKIRDSWNITRECEDRKNGRWRWRRW